MAGNWSDMGYRDGLNGESQTRLTEYANICAKYGATVDRQRYFTAYSEGLSQYCVPDNGYIIGESGRNYQNVCTAPEYYGFREAYFEGRAVYEAEQERLRVLNAQRDELLDYVERTDDALESVSSRLSDAALKGGEKRRLNEKRDRLERRRQDELRDLRRFERENGLSSSYE